MGGYASRGGERCANIRAGWARPEHRRHLERGRDLVYHGAQTFLHGNDASDHDALKFVAEHECHVLGSIVSGVLASRD